MSLVRCPVCRSTISDKAIICPHCGYTWKRNAIHRPKSYLTESLLLVLASLLLFTIWCLPFAIVAFIYAMRVDNLWNKGEYENALYASQKANRMFKIGLWVGLFTWIIALFLVAMFLALIF